MPFVRHPFTSPRAQIYAPATLRAYRRQRLGARAPHLFAVADNAFTKMCDFGENQSIVISGESGAGKVRTAVVCPHSARSDRAGDAWQTESTKIILQFLSQQSSAQTRVQQMLLETSPLLEAFGNAKTVRNNNSSRFGKFTKVFVRDGQIAAAAVEHYLLEKSRIVFQEEGDRNYHIFYYLLAGADTELRDALALGEPGAQYAYLGAPLDAGAITRCAKVRRLACAPAPRLTVHALCCSASSRCARRCSSLTAVRRSSAPCGASWPPSCTLGSSSLSTAASSSARCRKTRRSCSACPSCSASCRQ